MVGGLAASAMDKAGRAVEHGRAERADGVKRKAAAAEDGGGYQDEATAAAAADEGVEVGGDDGRDSLAGEEGGEREARAGGRGAGPGDDDSLQ